MKASFGPSVVRHSDTRADINRGIFLPDGSLYRQHSDLKPERIIVSGSLSLPEDPETGPRLVEMIRDPENPEKLVLLDWQAGRYAIVPHIECDGKIYAPPSPDGGLISKLTLPMGIRECGDLTELLSDFHASILEIVELSDRDIVLLVSFILATWFPDLFDAVPYLALIGPLGSAKTTLLKLLSCFCRRPLLVGDIRPAAVYQLVDALDCTLLIDEFEAGGPRRESDILRLLRSGSTRGLGAVRNARIFSTYGFKVIAARHLPADEALASRFVVIPMLPTKKELKPLTDGGMQLIADKFQSRFLMFRLKGYSAVRDFQMASIDLEGLSPRTRQLARVLAAPLEGDLRIQAELFAILRDQDRDKQVERSLEPEWLVAFALFTLCHERVPLGGRIIETLVGGVAEDVNRALESQGEDMRLSPRRVGAVLKSLGFRTEWLGNYGRGLRITGSFRRRAHEVARQLGIDRSHITSSAALDAGYGGAPCALCEEFGLTAGLRYVAAIPPMKPRRKWAKPRISIFSGEERKRTDDPSA